MKKNVCLIIVFLVIINMSCHAVNGIGINFNNSISFLDFSRFTSVVGNTNWLELTISTTSDAMVDYLDVGGSGIHLSVDSGNGRAANAAWEGWPQEIGFRTKDGDVIRCDISNIPYEKYKIIAYAGNLTAPQEASISIGPNNVTVTEKYYFSGSAVSSIPSLVQSIDTDDSNGVDSGSYVIFGSDENPLTGGAQVIKVVAVSEVSMFDAIEIIPVIRNLSLVSITSN